LVYNHGRWQFNALSLKLETTMRAPEPSALQILLIDDHTLFRRGLRMLLRDMDASLDVSEAGHLEEALGLRGSSFDLVLLDMNMPGRNGTGVIPLVREAFPSAAVVVVSGEDTAAIIRDAIAAGASGYIPKTSTPELMLGALRLVLANGVYLPMELLRGAAAATSPEAAKLAEPVAERPPGVAPAAPRPLLPTPPHLTARQWEILRLALRGVPNKVVAEQLGIAPGTVKSHLSTIYRALNVRNRVEAIYSVAKFGITP
jgi:DNA-binding NarL/FixJ family response regulator